MSETIIAQATPHGSSAIAVIRVSGPLSLTIAREACKIDSPTPRLAKLANYHNLDACCLVNNATIGLMLSLRVLGVSGEVITTPFSLIINPDPRAEAFLSVGC
mgnify:CR=1 FL=1